MEDTSTPMGAAPIGVQPERSREGQSTPPARGHNSILSGPKQAFCEGVARGLDACAAYCEAYQRPVNGIARQKAHRLMQKDEVKLEIRRLRAVADQTAGSAVLDCAKKRRFLARVVRADISTLDAALDGDLLEVCEMNKGKLRLRLFDKIRAIALDNDLAGEGAQAEALDEVALMIRRIMLENVPAHRKGGMLEKPPSFTLSGPQRIFCEGIVRGLSAEAAYCEAYPRSSEPAARTHGYRLLKSERVKAEIARLQTEAAKLAGSDALSLEEKQRFIARLIYANLATLNPALDGDLLQSYEVDNGKLRWRLADKLRAIAVDNDLAGKGTKAKSNAEFAAWAAQVRNSNRKDAPDEICRDAGGADNLRGGLEAPATKMGSS